MWHLAENCLPETLLLEHNCRAGRHSWKGKWGETRLKRDNSSWKREMGETRLKRGKNEAESRMLLKHLMRCYLAGIASEKWQPSNPNYIQSTMVEIFLYFFIMAIWYFNSWLSVVSSSKSSHWHGWRSRNVVWKYFVIDWLNWRIHWFTDHPPTTNHHVWTH